MEGGIRALRRVSWLALWWASAASAQSAATGSPGDQVEPPAPALALVDEHEPAPADVEVGDMAAPDDLVEPTAITRGGELSEPDEPDEDADDDGAPAGDALTFRVGDIVGAPSGELRARGELRLRSPGAPADRFVVGTRIRVGLELRWESVRAVIRVQDARDLGVTAGAPTSATTGLFEGYLEVADDGAFVRLGRQRIDVGTGRLVGSLDWATAARSFDALRLRERLGPAAAELFIAMTAPPRTMQTELGTTDGTEGDYLTGVVLEWFEPVMRIGLDVLWRHDGPSEQDHERRRDVVAFSLRADGSVDPVRYALELVSEVGSSEERSLLAFAAMGDVHVRLGEALRPEVGVGVSYATGDRPGGSVTELDNYYPANHLIYGLADLFGLRNQAQGYVDAILMPEPNLRLSASARLYALPEPGARWTDAVGRLVGVNAANPSGLLGAEFDVEQRWSLDPQFDLWAGYAIFVPAEAAVALGRPDPMHFAYLMLRYRIGSSE